MTAPTNENELEKPVLEAEMAKLQSYLLGYRDNILPTHRLQTELDIQRELFNVYNSISSVLSCVHQLNKGSN